MTFLRPVAALFRSAVPLLPLLIIHVPIVAGQEARLATVRGTLRQRDGGPIAGAQVQVAGSALRGVSGADGRYMLTDVPVGPRTLVVRAIGYAPVTQAITVEATGTTVDLVLDRSVVVLDELVATATGEQTRRSVASAVGTIQADSIARFAAVTSVDQVMGARIPGVAVTPQGGITGGSFTVRVRGTNSVQLGNQPIWIVDGIRLGSGQFSASWNVWDNAGLAALNPDDIKSLDVIKGPAAAALYGTQASNGVVVIKTKRGQPGPVQWSGYAEYGRVEQPTVWDDNWRSWGRNVVNGVPQTTTVQCRIASMAAGTCVIDSLTTFNPLRHPETTPYADAGFRTLFGIQASAGTEKVRYFASLEREDEQGPYTMPAAEVTRIRNTRGTDPTEGQIHPNDLGQFNLRGNFTAALAPTVELTLSGAYTSRRLQSPWSGQFTTGIQDQAVSAPGYRTAWNGYASEHLGDMMSLEVVDDESRTILSGTASWTPRPWLTARLTSGIDRSSVQGSWFAKNGEGPTGSWFTGLVGQGGGRYIADMFQQLVTTDFMATGTWDPTPDLSSRTTLGGQYLLTQWEYLEGSGMNLPPGEVRLNSGTVRNTAENWYEEATLGVYFEEALAWKERAFLTLGVRTDQNSQFGEGYDRVWYPRAGLSWVISDEGFFPKGDGLTSLRLRAAWGRAGIQPEATTMIETLGAGLTASGGQALSTLKLNQLGNANLKPEVVTEVELGFDLQVFRERLAVEATYFTKHSKDGLGTIQLPPSIGSSAQTLTVNVNSVQNQGFELAVDGQAVQSRGFSWNLRLTGSTLHNEVLDLGNQALASAQGITATNRTVEGYPVNGFWARPITGYADANGDGILVESEVTSDTAFRYVGPPLPTKELALTSTFGFFRDRLVLTAMADYRGGQIRWWNAEQVRCNGGNCRGVNDPTVSLAGQAAAVASQSALHNFTNDGYLKPADFVRLREVSAAWVLPMSWTRTLRMKAATLVVAGRNLVMVSSKYPGIDPEAILTGLQDNKWVIPPLRYWIIRLNLGF